MHSKMFVLALKVWLEGENGETAPTMLLVSVDPKTILVSNTRNVEEILTKSSTRTVMQRSLA